MNIDKYRRFDITLQQDEDRTMAQIVRLAHERLLHAEAQHMRGVPLERRAGLVGPDLIQVRHMLSRLAEELGVELQEEAAPEGILAVVVIGK